MGRACDYSEQLATMEDLQSRIQELEDLVARLLNQTPSTSTSSESVRAIPAANQIPPQTFYQRAIFLDAEMPEYCNIPATAADLPLPPRVSESLGGRSNIDQIKFQYFQSVNTWMPIINKTKLDRLVDGTQKEIRADLALLLLCMKQVQEVPLDTYAEPSSLYIVVKRFCFDMEMAGISSLLKVQAGLLIVVYELGHAIFPAAYRSIGDCARQGIALGIHDKLAPRMLRKPRNWLDWEERQRIWWLIVILDRLEQASASAYFSLTVS